VLACGRYPPLWATCAAFPDDQKLPSSMSLEVSRRPFLLGQPVSVLVWRCDANDNFFLFFSLLPLVFALAMQNFIVAPLSY